MAKESEESVEQSQRTSSLQSGYSKEPVVYGSSIGYFHADKISGDSHSTMRTTNSSFECYGQYGKRENTNQAMNAALNILVHDPHDPHETVPVVEKLKELWREGDTVGSLVNRYRRQA